MKRIKSLFSINLQAFILFIFIITSCKSNTNPIITQSERNQATEQIKNTLHGQQTWVKVHAAEYLLWLDYPQNIETIFKAENQTEIPYRIGVWRVLYQASENKKYKQELLKNFIAAFEDTSGADRIHAAETSAKLKINLEKHSPETVAKILSTNQITPLTLYTRFSAATDTSKEILHFHQNYFIKLLQQPETQEIHKKTISYILRHLPPLPAEKWKLFAEIALNQPDSSASKSRLASSVYFMAPADSFGSETVKKLKTYLLTGLNSEDKTDRMEAAFALAEKGKPEDLPYLFDLLNNKNPIKNNAQSADNADVMATAAYAILRLDRRQEYFAADADYFVLAAYLLLMLGIGIFYSRKNKNKKDFLLGGGKMNPVAVGLSLFATLLSSLSYLSYPGEMIKHGPVIFAGVLIFPLIYYIVGWFLIPKFMKMQVTSAYEILEIKLGLSVRMLATFFFLSMRFLWMATIIYVTANTAIRALFNIDTSYNLAISALLMIITIIYTSTGGLKAVVLTDVIQSVILLGGALVALFVVSMHFGSVISWLPNSWNTNWAPLKIGLDARERLTIANAVLMVFLWYICSSGSDQMAIQRYLATKDVRAARKTFAISLFTNFLALFLLGLVGLAMIAFFTSNPHFLVDGKNINQQADILFPRFILVGLPIGISGLVAAGILAAAMSSLSSGLNSSSSVISEDIIKRFGTKIKTAGKELKQVRLISFLAGLFALLLSISIGYVEGNLFDVINKVVNLFVSPLFVLFFMALFVPFATARATFIGGLASVAAAISVAFFKVFGIEVMFIMPTALATGIVTGVILSFADVKLFGNKETAFSRNHKN